MPADGVSYSLAAAEQLPFENEWFDLITVSSGIHWFDIDAFLSEANRLLKNQSFLVTYENTLNGSMESSDKLKIWIENVYLRNFPSPSRHKSYDWNESHMHSKKFIISIPENFMNAVAFSRRQFITYLTSQSNIIAVVESGKHSYAEVEQWLDQELSSVLEDEAKAYPVYFNNKMKYLQRI